MNIKQSVAKWLPCKIIDSSDFITEKGNIAYNDAELSVWYIKEGGDWAEKALAESDWDFCASTVGDGSGVFKTLFSELL